jgi:acyl-CoA reductase-like NAD-dependent aldehyde dehydrogenase
MEPKTKTPTKSSTTSNGTASASKASTKRIPVLKTYKIYIGGKFPRTESGRYYKVKQTNGEVVSMCLSSRKDFRNAVLVARAAQHGWASKSALLRSQILYRMAEMLETRTVQFISELEQMGSTTDEAQKEVETAIDRLIYFAGWCDKYTQVFSSVNPVASSHFNFSNMEPTGVVSAICDENSALLGLVSVIAPVIASGNSIVLLASENKALSAVTLAEVINDSDLPGGVVNILTGSRKELIEHFATHMDVNAIYLNTDKAEEQKYVQEKASLNVKRAIVEAPQNWLDASLENPYRIIDFTEVKTTWHPIGI